MAVKPLFTNCMYSVALVLVVCTGPGVYGTVYCESNSPFKYNTVCNDNQYCCGIDLNDCCTSFSGPSEAMEQIVALLMVLFIFICCPIMCYRCCCRRTTSRGIVYSPAGTTTAVSVTLPPQQNQPVPYPTVVPYPQQTPYPPQYPHNPYYGMPPPAYGVQPAGMQQSSAPSAPYPLS